MLMSPVAEPKTRFGGPCRSPAVSGKKRCRMHAGTPGSGAPKENQNAFARGMLRRGVNERKQVQVLLRESRNLIRGIERSKTNTAGAALTYAAMRCSHWLGLPAKLISMPRISIAPCPPAGSQGPGPAAAVAGPALTPTCQFLCLSQLHRRRPMIMADTAYQTAANLPYRPISNYLGILAFKNPAHHTGSLAGRDRFCRHSGGSAL
jgi:hypothetical protein